MPGNRNDMKSLKKLTRFFNPKAWCLVLPQTTSLAGAWLGSRRCGSAAAPLGWCRPSVAGPSRRTPRKRAWDGSPGIVRLEGRFELLWKVQTKPSLDWLSFQKKGTTAAAATTTETATWSKYRAKHNWKLRMKRNTILKNEIIFTNNMFENYFCLKCQKNIFT